MSMDIIKAFEEIQTHLFNVSPLLYGYYADLKKQGFSNNEALLLTRDIQGKLMEGGGNDGK